MNVAFIKSFFKISIQFWGECYRIVKNLEVMFPGYDHHMIYRPSWFLKDSEAVTSESWRFVFQVNLIEMCTENFVFQKKIFTEKTKSRLNNNRLPETEYV